MKRHNMLRRLLSVVLCFVMVFSLFPVSVFAEGAQEELVQAQEPVEPAEAPEQPGDEEAPEQPGDEIKETVKLRVDYVSEDGAALAEAYELSVEKGAALEVAVPFAAVEGFRPARVIFAALPENGDLALLVPEGTEPALTLGAEGESPIAVYGECANVQVAQEGLTLTGAAEADVSVVVTYAALEPSQTDTPAEPEQPADSSQQPAKAPANDLLSALTGQQTLGLGSSTLKAGDYMDIFFPIEGDAKGYLHIQEGSKISKGKNATIVVHLNQKEGDTDSPAVHYVTFDGWNRNAHKVNLVVPQGYYILGSNNSLKGGMRVTNGSPAPTMGTSEDHGYCGIEGHGKKHVVSRNYLSTHITNDSNIHIFIGEECHCGRNDTCKCAGMGCDCPTNCGCLNCINTTYLKLSECLKDDLAYRNTDIIERVTAKWTAEDGITRTNTVKQPAFFGTKLEVPRDRHFTLEVELKDTQKWDRKSTPQWGTKASGVFVDTNSPYFSFYDMYTPWSVDNNVTYDGDYKVDWLGIKGDGANVNPAGVVAGKPGGALDWSDVTFRFTTIHSFLMKLTYHQNGGTTARTTKEYREQNPNYYTSAERSYGKTVDLINDRGISGGKPVHANVNGSPVLFMGYTVNVDTNEKVYTAADKDAYNKLSIVTTLKLNNFVNTSVYPVWALDTNNNGIADVKEATYKVTYNAGAGSNAPVDSNVYVAGNTVTVKAGATAPSNHHFTGWSNGSTVYQPGQTFAITSNVTLTAQFEANKDYGVNLAFTGPNSEKLKDDFTTKSEVTGKYDVTAQVSPIDTNGHHYIYSYVTGGELKGVANAQVNLVAHYVLDDNHDDIDDACQITVTLNVFHGTFGDNTTTKNVAVSLMNGDKYDVNGTGTLTVPAGMKADAGYSGGGWDKEIPAEFTKDSATTYTYTYDEDKSQEHSLKEQVYYYFGDTLEEAKNSEPVKDSPSSVGGWICDEFSVIITLENNKFPGYRLDSFDPAANDGPNRVKFTIAAGEPTEIDEATGKEKVNIVKAYYVKDDSQKVNKSFTVEYYLSNGGTPTYTDSVTKSVWAGATTIPVEAKDINTADRFGQGYKFVCTDPNPLPTTIAVGGTIKVYYAKLCTVSYAYYTTELFNSEGLTAPEGFVDPPADAEAKLPTPAEYTTLDDVIIAALPDIPGYDFVGWYMNADEKIPGDKFTIYGDITLYGYFTYKDLTVTYKFDGTVPAGAELPNPSTVTGKHIGESIPAPTATVPKGYKLTWTSTDATVSADGSFTMPGNNVVMTGTFTEDRTQEHSVSAQVEYYYGDDLEEATGKKTPDAVDEVKTETGWIGEATTVTVTPKGNIFPGYKLDSVIAVGNDGAHTVNFTIAAGEATKENEVNIVKAYFIKDEGQTKDLSYKVGYYKDGVLVDIATVEKTGVWAGLPDTIKYEEGQIDFNKYPGFKYVSTEPAEIPADIAKDAIIKVNYSTIYTVTYELSDAPAGAAAPTDAGNRVAGDKVAVLAPTVPAGYTFNGWTSDDVTIENGKFTMPAKDVVLTGSFTANTNTGYKVEYYLQNLEDGTKYDLAADYGYTATGTTGAAATAVEKNIDGFTLDKNIEGTLASAAILGDGSLTLKLYYTRLNNLTYTVNYLDAEDTTKTVHTAKVSEADNVFGKTIVSKNEIIEIEGYTFDHSNPTSIEIGAVNENNVIDLYYTKDEKGITIIDDEEKQGDGIPDKFQITVNFASDENGTVTGTASELITIMNFDLDPETNAIVADSVVLKAEEERMPAAAVADDPADGYQAGVWYNGETAVEGGLETIRDTALTADTTYTVKHEKRNDLKYTVNYLDEDGNAIDGQSAKTVENQTFETVINSKDEIISIPYYVFDHADKANLTIGTGENVINLYYTEDKDNNGYPDEYEITVSFAAGANGTVTGTVSETITTQTFSRDADGNIIAGSVTDVEAHAAADVTAAPNAGFRFVNWTAGEASYADLAAIRALDLRGDTTFTANFAPRTDLAYTVNYLEAGTGTALAAPATVTGQTFGSTVTVNPIAIAGYATPAAQNITIAVTGNVINFYYAAIPVIPGNPVVDIPPIPPLPENIDDEITPLDGPEVTVDDPVNIDDEATPLAEGAHNSCILHFLILCAALLIELLYVSSMKQRQQKVFEIRRELKK